MSSLTHPEFRSIAMLDDLRLKRAKMAYRFGLYILAFNAVAWFVIALFSGNLNLLVVPIAACALYAAIEGARFFFGYAVAFAVYFLVGLVGLSIGSLYNVPNDGIPRTVHLFLLALSVNPYIFFYDRPLWVRAGLSFICIALFTIFAVTDISLVQHNPVASVEKRQYVAYTVALIAGLCIAMVVYYVHGDLTLRHDAEEHLTQAVIKQQLALFYQPQVDVSGMVVGAEALLRWLHPTLGVLSPDKFIPYAERSGSVVYIDQWVLAEACQQLSKWQMVPEMSELNLSINMSALIFKEADFVDRVMSEVQSVGIQPERLCLEITESVLLSDKKGAIDKINQLKAFGVRFSLDDVGTGYSTLSLVKDLPVSQLKIDREFVYEITPNTQTMPVTDTLVNLGQSMQVEMVAEGIETQAQWEYLTSKGCQYFQGYYFAKPVDSHLFEQYAKLKELGSMHT